MNRKFWGHWLIGMFILAVVSILFSAYPLVLSATVCVLGAVAATLLVPFLVGVIAHGIRFLARDFYKDWRQ